jgi:hypothetical protein
VLGVTRTLADLAGLPGHGLAARMPAAHSIPPILGCAVCEGFERGIPGEQLAQSAELSMSRVYQIGDGRR